MAGASFELESEEVRNAIGQTVNALNNPAHPFQVIIEYLHRAHRERFNAQVSLEGKAGSSPRVWGTRFAHDL